MSSITVIFGTRTSSTINKKVFDRKQDGGEPTTGKVQRDQRERTIYYFVATTIAIVLHFILPKSINKYMQRTGRVTLSNHGTNYCRTICFPYPPLGNELGSYMKLCTECIQPNVGMWVLMIEGSLLPGAIQKIFKKIRYKRTIKNIYNNRRSKI